MKKNIAIIQMFILIVSVAAFSYLAYETGSFFNSGYSESNFVKKTREIILGWMSGGLVSAQEEGLWTCLEDLNGSVCQEYPSDVCNDKCASDCFPGERENFEQCSLGTCIDSLEGTCSPNSPKFSCEETGGTWNNKDINQISECKLGCCVLGSNTKYVTEQACSVISSQTGIVGEFKPVNNEIECFALANLQSEGACVLGQEGSGYDCKFTNKKDCNSLGGKFSEGLLCSATELNTICKKQDKTSCMPGKDGVYWIDSCGNKENIYEGGSGLARDRSWNNGKVLKESDSCILEKDNDPLANQQSCGNCNYILGSVCGSPGSGDEKAFEGDFVCKDLSCIDSNGQERKNGESWCAFDSQIGNQGEGNGEISVDVPGSSHYRELCLDGEISIEPCQSGRREVCSETRNEDFEFSTAVCRINQWQKCFDLNSQYQESAQNGVPDETILNKCEQTTDCFIKSVDFGSKFKFQECVPKYPPGFSLDGDGGETAQTLCAYGTQKCTYIKTKGLFGNKKINQRCIEPEFTETLNNLCASLGDCGAQVNVIGEYSDEGYKINGAPELGNVYLNNLRKLIEVKVGQKTDSLSDKEVADLFGYDISDPNYKPSNLGETLGLIGTGAAGLELVAWQFSGAAAEGAAPFIGVVEGASPQLIAFGNAAAGAVLGAAVGYIIGKIFGLKGEALTHVVLSGVVSGAISGYFAGGALASGAIGPLAAFGIVLFWAVVVAVAVALIMNFLGIGKSKKTTVEFSCLPWQPPAGGENCGTCGADGLPCNEYKCKSLGQNCEFINEGTSDESCINSAPDDAKAPIIKPNENILEEGFSYGQKNNLGYSLLGPTSDGCLPVYTKVQFGVTTDEPAQCKIDIGRKDFDEMDQFFGGSNLYKTNHIMQFSLPSLASLESAGIDPDLREDYNLYVRCKDKAGNKNIQDYGINFCVSPQDDLTAPIINQFSPVSGEFVSINAEEKKVVFLVNEPAECKWDSNDLSYELMANEADCSNEVEDLNPFGFTCESNLPVTSDENTYYFRCKDQPWLEVSNPDNKERNVNSQSFVYTLKKTTSELAITEISPNGVSLESGGLPFVIDLTARTIGGAEGANRFCSFDFSNNGNFVRFFKSGGDLHEQPKLYLWQSGDYTIPIKCVDDVGNIAEAEAKFSLNVDSSGPHITRFYNSDGVLNIITNEESKCSYSLDSCSFNFGNGTLLSGDSFVHTTSIDKSLVYHVKCQDVFGNPGNACLSVGQGYF